MRNEWTPTILGDVCLIKPPKEEARQRLNASDLVSFVPMNDLNIGTRELSLKQEKHLSEVVGSYTYFAENDVLLAKITPCFENGKLGIARGLTNNVGFGSSEFIVFRSKGTIDPEYLYHYLSQESFRKVGARVMTGAVGHKRVPKEFIENHEISLPPLPEQKRIVAILDEAFEGIDRAVANAEKNLANARELFESYLNKVFTEKGDGWVEKKLSDLCSITSKLVDPREQEYIDLPHLGAGNIVSMTGEIIKVKTAREEGLKSGKFVFDKEMVLYSKIRPYLMKACRPDFVGLCSADIYPLSPKPKLLNRNFLYHLLMSKHFTDYAVAGSARAGMPKVNRDHLFNYRVYLPNISQQKRIAKKLDDQSGEVRRLESIYQRKLTCLAELKQSILQKAFSGELTTDVSTKKEAVA
jgi:type I restriction enzyme, S subunit